MNRVGIRIREKMEENIEIGIILLEENSEINNIINKHLSFPKTSKNKINKVHRERQAELQEEYIELSEKLIERENKFKGKTIGGALAEVFENAKGKAIRKEILKGVLESYGDGNAMNRIWEIGERYGYMGLTINNYRRVIGWIPFAKIEWASYEEL